MGLWDATVSVVYCRPQLLVQPPIYTSQRVADQDRALIRITCLVVLISTISRPLMICNVGPHTPLHRRTASSKPHLQQCEPLPGVRHQQAAHEALGGA